MMSTPKNIGFLRRIQDFLEPLGGRELAAQVLLFVREMPDDVFHHHDRAINDEAEVNRAKAHQVARHPALDHAGHGEKHGQRDGQRDDERRAQIAEQREEHHHDQQRSFKQTRLDRMQRAVHQVRAVVERSHFDTRRKFLLNMRELRRHVARDDTAVAARQHEGSAHHTFLAVDRGRARSIARTNPDLRDVLDPQRPGRTGELQRDVGDLLGRADAAVGANDDLFAANFDQAAAEVLGVLRNLVRQFRQTEAHAREP
jgi:hypothetical protein